MTGGQPLATIAAGRGFLMSNKGGSKKTPWTTDKRLVALVALALALVILVFVL